MSIVHGAIEGTEQVKTDAESALSEFDRIKSNAESVMLSVENAKEKSESHGWGGQAAMLDEALTALKESLELMDGARESMVAAVVSINNAKSKLEGVVA